MTQRADLFQDFSVTWPAGSLPWVAHPLADAGCDLGWRHLHMWAGSISRLSPVLPVFRSDCYPSPSARQGPCGTRHRSTRRPPTSTSPPCRPSWPLTSPSTSRAALIRGSSWKTWASRTSSDWSSPVSPCSDSTDQRVHGVGGGGGGMRADAGASGGGGGAVRGGFIISPPLRKHELECR